MKRVLILFCAFVISSSFFGCSTNTTDSEQALNIAQELLLGYDEIISIYDLGNISSDESVIVLDEDMYEYFVVKNNKYKSIDELKESTQRVLSYNFSCSYFFRAFSSEERPLYKDIDGELCRSFGDMTVMCTPQKTDLEIQHFSSEILVFSVSSTERESLNVNYKFIFTALQTKDGWRIDNVVELD